MKNSTRKTVKFKWEYFKPDPHGRVFHTDAEWEWYKCPGLFKSRETALKSIRTFFNRRYRVHDKRKRPLSKEFLDSEFKSFLKMCRIFEVKV